MIGERLKHAFVGNEAWVLSYREECFDQIGLKPSKKVLLFNGALECEFRKYEIFDGKYKEFKSQEEKEKRRKRLKEAMILPDPEKERNSNRAGKENLNLDGKASSKPRREGEFKPRREGEYKPRREEGSFTRDDRDRKPRGEFRGRRFESFRENSEEIGA